MPMVTCTAALRRCQVHNRSLPITRDLCWPYASLRTVFLHNCRSSRHERRTVALSCGLTGALSSPLPPVRNRWSAHDCTDIALKYHICVYVRTERVAAAGEEEMRPQRVDGQAVDAHLAAHLAQALLPLVRCAFPRPPLSACLELAQCQPRWCAHGLPDACSLKLCFTTFTSVRHASKMSGRRQLHVHSCSPSHENLISLVS